MLRRKLKYLLWLPALGFLLIVPVGAGDSYFEVSKNLEIFSSLYKELNIYYVDEMDANKSMRTAIDAMLGDLDPYTNFISEAEMEAFRFQTTGRYGGIGAVIRAKDGYIGVVEVHEGTPSHKAKLQAGDLIIAVDGRSTEGRSSDDVSKLLRGTPGTEVEVKVRRKVTGEEFSAKLLREEISLKNVPYYGMAAEGIGYIRLEQFTEKSGLHVQEALKDLEKKGKLNGLILDLRGNPGGLLHEAVNVANVFIPKGKLVVDTKGRVPDWDQKRKTLSDPVDTDIRLVILTDNGSASASEIVAGVMQDYDRGLVVGRKTFGKGLVQQTRDLSYKTKLKITIAKYYTPSGRCIQALDYSHRDANGKAEEVPDSLRRAFKTSNGRTVFDGAGIEPDIKVDPRSYPLVLASLMSKDLVFDFATEYRYKRQELASAADFHAGDEVYQEFLDYIKDKDYSYQTQSEKTIDRLETQSKDEKYYDALSQEIEDLRAQITADKMNDLARHRDAIVAALESEIISRYYMRAGRIEASFDDDPDITEALALLKNPELYRQLLSP